MAITDLSLNSDGKPLPLAHIAGRQEVSLAYLEQIFAKLRRAGLVKSTRGPGGGYVLAKKASEISVANVLDAVEECLKATRCKSGGAGCQSKGARCVAHHLWQELGDQIYHFLSQISLEDVCAGRFKVPLKEEPVARGVS